MTGGKVVRAKDLWKETWGFGDTEKGMEIRSAGGEGYFLFIPFKLEGQAMQLRILKEAKKDWCT